MPFGILRRQQLLRLMLRPSIYSDAAEDREHCKTKRQIRVPMNAVSGTILVVLLVVVCFAPRRWALLAMMAGVFFLTQGHSVDVAGLNLYPIRFLSTAAFSRVLVRRELAWSPAESDRRDITAALQLCGSGLDLCAPPRSRRSSSARQLTPRSATWLSEGLLGASMICDGS